FSPPNRARFKGRKGRVAGRCAKRCSRRESPWSDRIGRCEASEARAKACGIGGKRSPPRPPRETSRPRGADQFPPASLELTEPGNQVLLTVRLCPLVGDCCAGDRIKRAGHMIPLREFEIERAMRTSIAAKRGQFDAARCG